MAKILKLEVSRALPAFFESGKNKICTQNVTKIELRIRKNCTFHEKWLLFQLYTYVLLHVEDRKLKDDFNELKYNFNNVVFVEFFQKKLGKKLNKIVQNGLRAFTSGKFVITS